MDLFPYIRADGYFEVEYDKEDPDLKKYFIAQIPVYLHKENIAYLKDEPDSTSEIDRLVHVSIVRSRRKDAADQIQMSMTNIDSPEYVDYRKLVHTKSYMILLKRKQKLLYDLYSVKESDGDSVLKDINNGFYKLGTNTPVKLDEIVEDKKNREVLIIKNSKECAKRIIDCIYSIDGFGRLEGLIQDNEKNLKINTEQLGGNYLRYIFAKRGSGAFENTSGGKDRTFTDKQYTIPIDNESIICRLSTEWVSSELGDSGTSANYLKALISVVNSRYSDSLKIYEESGEWYIEHLAQRFLLKKLPDVFDTPFARRYITSLLAKPFVILTGNSGAGKTRISKQFAKYLEICSDEGEKNWVLIPVGADWTDNTKILGFYNPLANEGKGKYEETEILRLIKRANENKLKPYFIILDEMNLSHVERYFADFLSHMETINIPFILDGTGDCVDYPENVFVVGTVNIDETTYMFSPKVLDRANVIEFKPEEESLMDLFMNPAENKDIVPAGNGMAEAFLTLSESISKDVCGLSEDVLNRVQNLFREVYKITAQYGFEFAYRTVKEIRRYISAAYELSDDGESFDVVAAEDEQLLQKVLPKIHGNRKEIGQLLEDLDSLCERNNLKMSKEKIKQMKEKLAKVQYASFI